MSDWDWEQAAQIGSFVGGIATIASLLGLVIIYLQLRDARKADQIVNEYRLQEARDKEADERGLALAKFAEEISLSTNTLLVERSKLWAQALN
jgi:hypothetical protein